NSVKNSYLNMFSSDKKASSHTLNTHAEGLIAGDICPVNNSVLYYKIPDTLDYISIGEVSYEDDFKELGSLSKKTETVLTGMNIPHPKSWLEVKIEENITNSLKEGSRDVKYSRDEVKSAGILENKFAYSLLKEIYNKKNSSIKKLTEAFNGNNKDEIEKNLEIFENAGLINKDYVILCKKSNQQILQVSSKEAIEETSKSTFKCFICGNPIASEEIDEIIACSDFGKKLLENDHWLLIKFLSCLDKLQTKKNNIYIQSDNLSMQKIFIQKNQKLILVIICNKKLELNDSYQISSLINTFGVPFTILISPGNFTYLMKSYLKKSASETQFSFIENLQHLEKEITAIFNAFDKNLMEETFFGFNDLTYIDLQDAVLSKIIKDNGKESNVKTKSKK
ncbi:MAG: hypothetical protein ABIH00_10525, partial [Armatimonadota bacterium]